MNYHSKENEEMLQQAINSIEDYTQDATHFFQWLDWMATFPQYSVRNQLLIKQQRPKAQLVANENRFDKYNQKPIGKPITILAPDIYEYIEVNGQEIEKDYWTREQFKAVKNKEIKTFTNMNWKNLTVYEVDNHLTLDKKEQLVPQLPLQLSDQTKEDSKILYQALKNIAVDHQIKIIETPIENQRSEIVRSTKNKKQMLIRINPKDLSDSAKLSVAIHQIGYALSYQNKASKDSQLIAELNSYIIAKACHVEPLPQTTKYIQDNLKKISSRDNQEIVNLLDQSAKLSKKMITELSPELNRLSKIMERKPHQEQKEPKNEISSKVTSTNKSKSLKQSKILTKNLHAKNRLHNLKYFFNRAKTLMQHIYYRFHVQLDGKTSLDSIQKAKTQKKESVLEFKVNGKHFSLATNRQTGESRLYQGLSHPQLLEGKAKYEVLKKIEPYDYLPMSVKEYEKMDQLKEKHLYQTDLSYQFLNQSNQQDKLKFNRLNKQFDFNTGQLIQPFISINKDSGDLKAGMILTVDEFNTYSKNHMDSNTLINCNIHYSPNEYNTLSNINMEEIVSSIQPYKASTAQIVNNSSDELELLHLPITDENKKTEYHIQVNPQTNEFTGTYEKNQHIEKLSHQKGIEIFQIALQQLDLASDEREIIQNVLNKEEEKQSRIDLFENHQQRIEATYPIDIPTNMSIQSTQYKEMQSKFDNNPIHVLNEKGIDNHLLSLLNETQFLTIDSQNQLHFNWNENGKKVGETIYSSNLEPQSQSKMMNNTGFNIKNGTEKQLKCFENPLELISYISLNGIEKDTCYLSLDVQTNDENLKNIENTFKHFLGQSKSLEKIDICIANEDRAKQVASILYPQANQEVKNQLPFNLVSLKTESSFLSRCQSKQASITQGLSPYNDSEISL